MCIYFSWIYIYSNPLLGMSDFVLLPYCFMKFNSVQCKSDSEKKSKGKEFIKLLEEQGKQISIRSCIYM